MHLAVLESREDCHSHKVRSYSFSFGFIWKVVSKWLFVPECSDQCLDSLLRVGTIHSYDLIPRPDVSNIRTRFICGFVTHSLTPNVFPNSFSQFSSYAARFVHRGTYYEVSMVSRMTIRALYRCVCSCAAFPNLKKQSVRILTFRPFDFIPIKGL